MRLHKLVAATTALLGSLALCAALALVLISSRMAHHTNELFEGVRALAHVEQLRAALVIHGDVLRELSQPTGEVTVRSLMEAERAAWENLVRASLDAANGGEKVVLEELEREMRSYLEESKSLLVLPTPPEGIAPRMQRLAELLGLTQRLEQARTTRLEATADRVARWNRRANVLGYAVSLLLLVGVGVVLWGQRRWLSGPLSLLHGAIVQFGQQKRPAAPPAVPATGVEELRDLGRAFGELAARLEEQRERQLAFVAGAAHDLKNPLATLALSAAKLRRLEAAHDAAVITEHAARIERQVIRLRRLLDDLLDTTRIEAGRISLEVERRDLLAVVRETVDLYRDASPGHELLLECAEDTLFVPFDGHRISQVLHNLIGNAIKYSPHGGKVHVAVGRRDGCAVVSVTDEGIGIPREELAHLFEPFRRTEATRLSFPGIGLGLSVSDRIARAHGGSIEVESRLGEGSVFRLLLPLAGPPDTVD